MPDLDFAHVPADKIPFYRTRGGGRPMKADVEAILWHLAEMAPETGTVLHHPNPSYLFKNLRYRLIRVLARYFPGTEVRREGDVLVVIPQGRA